MKTTAAAPHREIFIFFLNIKFKQKYFLAE
jgi:hypothetical protein